MPKYRWQIAASQEVEQPDGSVRLECVVRRNGKLAGTLVLMGTSNVAKASDLQPWWFPNGSQS